MVYEAHYSDGLAALVYLIIEYNMKTGGIWNYIAT